MSKEKVIQSLYKQVYLKDALFKAWQQIYQNGISSDSLYTRQEVKNFRDDEPKNIRRIRRALENNRFSFSNNKGIFVGKKSRPIILAPVESRIVQRSILNVLQSIQALEIYYRNKGSFGAIGSRKDDEKGVPAAIHALTAAIRNRAKYYYKSDVKQFFTQIPRKSVITQLKEIIKDDQFIELIDQATNLEIDNINSIPEKERKYFIYDEIGTPQGCCLSPLFGNILLNEFDSVMNTPDIVCLRYLDDFIILGPDQKSVKGMFKKGLEFLTGLELSAYELGDNSKKASIGRVCDKFEFLGVEINGTQIKPSVDSEKRMLKAIKGMANDSMRVDFFKKSTKKQRENSLIKTLNRMNNKIQGWGNQYFFCNDLDVWKNIDKEISEIIRQYLGQYTAKKRKLDDCGKRRLLGIHLISESKSEPITF